jgi:hypothetical protein
MYQLGLLNSKLNLKSGNFYFLHITYVAAYAAQVLSVDDMVNRAHWISSLYYFFNVF